MTSNPNCVFMFAPQGRGKTRHSAQMAEMFGCTSIVDDWDGVKPLPDNALVLCQGVPATDTQPAKAHGLPRGLIGLTPGFEPGVCFGTMNCTDAQFAMVARTAASLLKPWGPAAGFSDDGKTGTDECPA